MAELPRVCRPREMSSDFRRACVELAKNPLFDKGHVLSSNSEVFFTTMTMIATAEQLQKMMEDAVNGL